mmetsp:Transcript_28804/g.95726  ORF Transcript_28804/g.95726 Transcript_28804/m.95726 type:complete len:235 (-) Transcript_28804:53-757(-)
MFRRSLGTMLPFSAPLLLPDRRLFDHVEESGRLGPTFLRLVFVLVVVSTGLASALPRRRGRREEKGGALDWEVRLHSRVGNSWSPNRAFKPIQPTCAKPPPAPDSCFAHKSSKLPQTMARQPSTADRAMRTFQVSLELEKQASRSFAPLMTSTFCPWSSFQRPNRFWHPFPMKDDFPAAHCSIHLLSVLVSLAPKVASQDRISSRKLMNCRRACGENVFRDAAAAAASLPKSFA